MRRIHFILLFFLLLLGACTQRSANEFQVIIEQADKAIVYSYNPKQTEPYNQTKELSKAEILQFKQLMSNTANVSQECNYEGAIFFYQGEETTLRMRFSTSDNCYKAIYLKDGQLHTQHFQDNISFVGILNRVHLR